jgi:hypothetical protein
MLRCLRHPVYENVGSLDAASRYLPARFANEAVMRLASENALDSRQTKYSLLDDAHHLVHTGNAKLRANVLDSVKCLTAIDRTLVLFGGYELAYSGFFDSSHFAGRLVIIEFPPYIEADRDHWLSILKTLGRHLPLDSKHTLISNWEILLSGSNGTYGLLDKWLWQCKLEAERKNVLIDKGMLLRLAPPEAERAAIADDIKKGRDALAKISERMGVRAKGEASLGPKDKPGPQRVPFETKPVRRPVGEAALVSESR